MTSRTRVPAALLVVAATACFGLPGAGAAVTAAAPDVAGGCWSYVPSGPLLESPPLLDSSTQLEPWFTSPEGDLRVETGGDTVVGGTRVVTATLTGGPVFSETVDVSGTATLLLSADGAPLATPVVVPFTAAAGEPVADLVAQVELPLLAAGPHRVELDALYLDAPAAVLRLACNGQESGTPGGPNPGTDPQPTGVGADFTVVGAAALSVTAVDDQAVVHTARPGDTVSVAMTGLVSLLPVTVQLCSDAGTCADVGGATAALDGTATATFTVPGFASAGRGTLRVATGLEQVETAFTVLGTQVVAAAEELTADTTLVTLTGTGWDPERPVTVRGFEGPDSSSAPTDDPEVVADVDAAGQFTAVFEVADEATGSVIVDQARSAAHIGAVYLISGVIGGAPASDPDPDPDTDDPDEETPSGGSTTGTSGVTAPPVAAPPVDIPLPGNIPVVEPPVETPGTDDPQAAGLLSVTEARLDGRTAFGELFGGAPSRTLIFLVENVGTAAVSNPVVRVSVGRSEGVEPEIVDAEVGDLDPGEQAVVSVPLQLPMAAFGDYHVVGQVGDGAAGAFDLDWTTYPVGLFVLNALALLLLAWGVRHRMLLRRTPSVAQLAALEGDAVIDMAAADAWWSRGSGGPAGALGAEADAAVVDLDAAERWWGRSSHAS